MKKLGIRKLILIKINPPRMKKFARRPTKYDFMMPSQVVFRFVDDPETMKRTSNLCTDKDGREYIVFSSQDHVYYLDEAVQTTITIDLGKKLVAKTITGA